MLLGAHMSTAGGVDQALWRGRETGCQTIQIFSKNANRWRARAFTAKEVAKFHQAEDKTGISPVLVHTSYLINLASPEDELWGKSIESLGDELERCRVLGLPYLILHPGAHRGAGVEAGIARIAEGLDRSFEKSSGKVRLLLEITAGQGSSIGSHFEEIARIMEKCGSPERLGVCFDTCHAYAAGYDLSSEKACEATFSHFNQVIGLDQLLAVHLNDSKGKMGSHLDRHQHIGQGELGREVFRFLLNDPRFQKLPMVLETPKGPEMKEDVENLSVLRSLIAG